MLHVCCVLCVLCVFACRFTADSVDWKSMLFLRSLQVSTELLCPVRQPAESVATGGKNCWNMLKQRCPARLNQIQLVDAGRLCHSEIESPRNSSPNKGVAHRLVQLDALVCEGRASLCSSDVVELDNSIAMRGANMSDLRTRKLVLAQHKQSPEIQ